METFNVYLLQRNVEGWNQEVVQYKMEVLIDFLTVVSHNLMSWSDRLSLVNSINPVYYTLLIYLLTVWQENLVIMKCFMIYFFLRGGSPLSSLNEF